MYELKEYLNSINLNKQNLMDGDDPLYEKKYPAFIINKCLAPFNDTIMLVNEMNINNHLDNKRSVDQFWKEIGFDKNGKTKNEWNKQNLLCSDKNSIKYVSVSSYDI